MAIQNNPYLYSGGNVVFNPNPHVQLYANLLARQSARRDAFDEYMKNLNKGINSAGLRNVDRPAFDKALNDFQQFAMGHSDEIRNRKNGADIELMNKYQTANNIVAESKGEEDKKKPLIEKALDPNFRDRVNYPDVHNMLQSHDQPLYLEDGVTRNPNRKSLDISSIDFHAKPMDISKFNDLFKDVKRSDLPPVPTFDEKNKTQTVTTTSVFDDDGKAAIATRAVQAYMSDPSVKETIDKFDKKDYNKFFKDNYGHDINNQGDLAAAVALKSQQQKVTTSKYEPDTYARQLDLQKRSQGFQSWLRKQPTYKDMNGSDDDILSTNKIVEEVSEITRNGKPSAEGHGWMDVNDPTVLAGFKNLAPSSTAPPNSMRYNPSTNQLKFVYTDTKGNEEYVGIEPSSYLKYKVKQTYPNKDIGNINNSVSQLYESSGGRLEAMMAKYSELERKAALEKAKPTAKPQSPTYNYKGKSITQTQLENAAKASGMSVDDYKKQIGLE